MEKLKFAQHLEWKSEESLSAKLWRMEKESKVSGLKNEIEDCIEKYSLPPPSRLLSNDQYKKVLKKAIREESRSEIREKLFESSKLRYLAGWDQKLGPQMSMTDLKKIQFLTRCRLSCQFSFSADFGSGARCPCGELDTMGHVRRGCEEYHDILPEDPEEFNKLERAELLYTRIMTRHDRMGEDARGGAANTSPPPTPPPTRGCAPACSPRRGRQRGPPRPHR